MNDDDDRLQKDRNYQFSHAGELLKSTTSGTDCVGSFDFRQSVGIFSLSRCKITHNGTWLCEVCALICCTRSVRNCSNNWCYSTYASNVGTYFRARYRTDCEPRFECDVVHVVFRLELSQNYVMYWFLCVILQNISAHDIDAPDILFLYTILISAIC